MDPENLKCGTLSESVDHIMEASSSVRCAWQVSRCLSYSMRRKARYLIEPSEDPNKPILDFPLKYHGRRHAGCMKEEEEEDVDVECRGMETQ